jgi:hypothetical protein
VSDQGTAGLAGQVLHTLDRTGAAVLDDARSETPPAQAHSVVHSLRELTAASAG